MRARRLRRSLLSPLSRGRGPHPCPSPVRERGSRLRRTALITSPTKRGGQSRDAHGCGGAWGRDRRRVGCGASAEARAGGPPRRPSGAGGGDLVRQHRPHPARGGLPLWLPAPLVRDPPARAQPLDRFALSLGLAAPARAVPRPLLVAFGHRAPRRDRAEIRAADRALRARACRARRRGGRDRALAAGRLDQALPHACRDGRARPRRREMGARVRHRIRGARPARACREGAASRPDADRSAAFPRARRGSRTRMP